MQFAQVVGQEQSKEQLINLVKEQRIPHASLLQGSPGNGVLPLAIAWATFIMCEAPLLADSCGQCSNCKKNKVLMHPDVHYSYPVINNKDKGDPISDTFMKEFRTLFTEQPYADAFTWLQNLEAGNKQGNITALETLNIIKKLTLKSFEGGYKILIMWLPEFLGEEGNRLLKLIEEPPANTIIILGTENPDNIIGTIKSRTQLIPLHPLADLSIKNALIADGVDDKMATSVARMAEGNYFEALKIAFHHQDAYFDYLKTLLNILFTNNGLALIDWIAQIAELGREAQKQFLLYFINMLEHYARIKYGAKHNLLLQEEELAMINKMVQLNISNTQIENITTILSDATYHIERNLNAKIVFHAVGIKLKNILTKK